ncbi:MAG: cupin domain-containing protein [Planctomycetaceae bacterium]|nr:cupin-like domain-containing protein [Planctomycetaceae bacterium]
MISTIPTQATTANTENEATTVMPGRPYLHYDPNEFANSFSKQPFLIDHALCEHPLFQMERLLELAGTLPPCQIEYNAGKLPVSISHEQTPQNGLSPAETIRRIADCESWLVLKYVEKNAAYHQILDDCLAQIRPLTENICPGMTKPHAFIFITSPGSITPYHIDPEHNFLLQIQGSKTIRMYDGNDPSILNPLELEHFYCDRGRNLVMQEQNRERCWTYQLNPGQGLHFPVTFPHWVENNEEISISFSITFRTPDLDKRRAIFRTNDRLRKLGFQPTPPGQNRLRDTAYYQAFRAVRKVKSMFSSEQ